MNHPSYQAETTCQVQEFIGPEVSLILSSVPEAVGFYERIGMPQLPNGYWFRRAQ